MVVFKVDILVGGSEHDLLDQESQADWLARLEAGEFDAVMLSPPCGSWSRANWANGDGPKPCRNRKFPWGIPHLRRGAQRRAHDQHQAAMRVAAATTKALVRMLHRLHRCRNDHLFSSALHCAIL